MGAITLNIDRRLVECIKGVLDLKVFVGTGNSEIDSVQQMLDFFERIVSVEARDCFPAGSHQRLKGEPKVDVRYGRTVDTLNELSSELRDLSTLFWLDADCSIGETSTEESGHRSLLAELESLESLNDHSVIAIDDARLLLALPPGAYEAEVRPTFDEILIVLRRLNSGHRIAVVNDVIVFYPANVESAIGAYARTWGFDWLAAVQSMEELTRLADTLGQMKVELARQRKIIEQQARNLRHIHALSAVPGVRPAARLVRRLGEIIKPRLGWLSQYPPRPLATPAIDDRPVEVADFPTISIVTPSYQQGSYIEETILSVIDQGYPNLEYYIQDGGSSDTTTEVLRSYEHRLHGWISEPDSGQSQAINRGFGKVSGEIMAWLNSDDLLLPGTLFKVARYFRDHPEVDVVYGNRLMIDERSMDIGRWVLPGHDGSVLSWADYVPQETLFWRRELWNKVGANIDESYRFAMDWDLLVRFRDAGARFAHIPDFLGAFRIHEAQKTSAVITEIGHQEMERIRLRTLGYAPDRRQIRKAIIPFMLKHTYIDMLFRIRTRIGRGQKRA